MKNGDQIRIEFGVDARFLPMEGVEGSLAHGPVQFAQLCSTLVSDVERNMPLERRRIWSESGVNFADLLAETVVCYSVNQSDTL